MADSVTFRQEMIEKVLYEKQEGSTLPGDILTGAEPHRRLSPKMAQLKCAIDDLISTFPPSYREAFGNFTADVAASYRSVDGWSVDKAITAQGVMMQQKIEGKKNAWLSFFGIGE